MAQLISWLALAGARTSAGAAVSSGTAWFYQPGGGTTLATVYSDVDGTVVATNPATLDAGGRATVYVTSPVRIVVQSSAGADVSDVDQADVTRAETVQLANTGWSDTYLDAALTKLYTSVGGVDGQYMESGGATLRTIKAKFAELSISVKDFGAKGDGLTVDRTAIQAAINRVGFLGGGEVYFPPGTYLIDQVLTNAVSGVSFRGASATLKNTSATGSLLTVTGASNFSIRNLYMTNSGVSTGAALTLATCSNVIVSGVRADLHRTTLAMTSASSVFVDGARLLVGDADSAARAFSITDSSPVTIAGSYTYGGTTGQSIEYLGSSAACVVTGSYIDTAGIKFNSGLTGTGFRIVGNTFTAATAFIFGGATMPKGFYQAGNGIDGYKGTLLSGATFTPDLSKGSSITIDCTTTGSANTVAVPTPPPAATDYGVYMDIVYYAHAGGALTAGSGFAAGYHVSSAASLTDTNRTSFRFHWDPDASVWRDVSRSVTT